MIDASRLRQRLGNARRILGALPRAYGIVHRAAPGKTLLLTAVTLLSGAIPVALLAITKPTVDAVAGLVSGSGTDWSQPLMLVAGVAFLLVLAEAIAALLNWVRVGHGEQVATYVRGSAQDQSSRVAMSFYEQPEFFDHLHRARDAAAERPVQLIDGLTEVARAVVALAGVSVILLGYAWWLPVLLAVAMLPALASGTIHALRQHRFELATTVDERHAWYFDWLLTDRSAAGEMRSFGLAGHYRERYRKVREHLRHALQRLHGKEALIQVALAVLGLLSAGAAVLWMLMSASRGEASLGDVALCYQAFVQGSGLMRGGVRSLALVYRNALFLDDFFHFLGLPADAAEAAADPTAKGSAVVFGSGLVPPAIRFEGVVFRYPGCRRPALAGLDLEIPPGTIAAILGPNGAGKSTLVKLLCRFYDPAEGALFLDGKDARAWSVHDLRRLTSVLFQKPLQFAGTVAENVLPLAPEACPRIIDGLRAAQAEAMVAALPDGIQTRLAAWFPGGTDLSGGEWQRIAMARAFARDAPILVLDEPTSAMDPWAEREWLAGLRSHARGRTVLLITHRLTTAMEADVIHVMENGRVVESGSHAHLLAAGSAYAELWGAPAEVPAGQS